MMQRTALPLLAAALLFSISCSRGTEPSKPPVEESKSPASKTDVPQTFRVQFDTSKGPFIIEVNPARAPIGVARFNDLLKDRFFDGARFFRIVPNFIVQFGLAADAAKTRKWDKPIQDDPVAATNRAGSLSFATAGPNTRTTQIFINLRSNQSLDGQGFAPFAQVVEGMNVIERLHSGYGEGPDQEAITRRGNAYLLERFPDLDYIKTARRIEP